MPESIFPGRDYLVQQPTGKCPHERLSLTFEPVMGTVVNLRTARKRAKRRLAEQKAAANRLAHGTSKAETNLKRARSDKDQRNLDLHRVERGDEQ